MIRAMNIYLCGMIGSGKTSIGRAISRIRKRPFFDVDQIMEKEAGKRIHDIVAEEGWVSYREREYQICKRLSKLDQAVVALAGGTVRYAWNIDVLKGSGIFVLLTGKLQTLAERARKNDRPRVNAGTTLEQDLALLWKKSKHLYLGAADLIYKTDRGKTVGQEAEEIIRILKRRAPAF